VRKGGFEPPRYCYRQPLKLVRLPVPPLPRGVGVGGLIPDPASLAAGSCEPSVYATHCASDNDTVLVNQRRTLEFQALSVEATAYQRLH
jgi:hypothetical protein